jgi:hypothetical protein
MPRLLNLVTLFTKDADAGSVPPMIAAAREIYGRCGFELRVWPGDAPTSDTVLDIAGSVDPFVAKYGILAPVAGRFGGLVAQWLWVVFCPMRDEQRMAGYTMSDPDLPGLRPFAFVNTTKGPLSPPSTLAHEMGHAGLLEHTDWDRNNLMFPNGSLRTGTELNWYQTGVIAARAHFVA